MQIFWKLTFFLSIIQNLNKVLLELLLIESCICSYLGTFSYICQNYKILHIVDRATLVTFLSIPLKANIYTSTEL